MKQIIAQVLCTMKEVKILWDSVTESANFGGKHHNISKKIKMADDVHQVALKINKEWYKKVEALT